MSDGSGCLPLLLSLIALLILSAFFSATETAFSCVNRIKLKSMAANGKRLAAKVLHLSENNFDRLISTILIGNNIVNLSSSAVATVLFTKLLANSSLNPSVISTVVITIAVLIFGEITPKYIAKSCPESFAMTVYPIIKVCIYIFYPLNILFSLWKTLITKVLKFKNNEIITEEEIITMVEEAKEDGTLKQEETNLIRSVIEFDDLEVSDILVPRVNISAVDKNSSLKEIHDTFLNTGFSRLPVFDKNIDLIVGTIHEKDFFKIYSSENTNSNIENIIKPPFFVTSHTKISKLLKQMQNQKYHMAVVLDEYGGTLGLVTMEDILEELVGEIYDEHDKQIEYVKKLSQKTFIVDGEMPLNKFFKQFDLEDDEDFESNTLAGWITEKLGDFPEQNCKISHKNLELEVLSVEEHKVLSVKVTVA